MDQDACSPNHFTNSTKEIIIVIQGLQRDNEITVFENADHEVNNFTSFIYCNYIHMTRHNTIDDHKTQINVFCVVFFQRLKENIF